MVRKQIALGALALIFALALPTASEGAPIIECGNLAGHFVRDQWTWYWTYSHSYIGYTPVTNLTTRNVRCSYARPFSYRATPRATHLISSRFGSGHIHYQGFTCIIRWFYGEEWDIRCTKGNQVIHWQGGA